MSYTYGCFDDEDDPCSDDYNGPIGCDDEHYRIDGVGFANPGGNSALRAATRGNPRNLPCPTCKQPNRLTPADVRKHYQCDACADRDEGIGCY